MRAPYSMHHQQCVYCSPWLCLGSLTFFKFHPAGTNPPLFSLFPVRPGASLDHSGVFCLMQREVVMATWISTWRRMRGANAWGLTFGEACCAPGSTGRREISPLKSGQVVLRRLKTFFTPVDQGLCRGVTIWISSASALQWALTNLEFRFRALAPRRCPSLPNNSKFLYILHFEVPFSHIEVFLLFS